MNTSLNADALVLVNERLALANREHAARYPGDDGRRQPVHVVYGGAHIFKRDAIEKLAALARRSLDSYAPDAFAFARALNLPGAQDLNTTLDSDLAARLANDPALVRRVDPAAWFAHTVYERVKAKLAREAVEDFRIDFEDGYGHRRDEEEDAHAAQAARELAAAHVAGQLPPYCGVRVKPLNEELRARSVRTLDIFLTTLAAETGGALPPNFVVTLPKVTAAEQCAALADLFDLLEQALKLAPNSLKLELMVETPQAVIDHAGTSALPRYVEAARGRCVAAHFGAYDYTASLSVTAAHQTLAHAACDFARHAMQVSLAGTGVWLADGATNVLPVPVHRAAEGVALTEEQEDENREGVRAAWRLHAGNVRRSLAHGFYQGWDLHPSQLPARYGAVYAFFLESLDAASARLRNFVEQAARASLVGSTFDDAATGQGLLNYFVRAVSCGALSEEEAAGATGLTLGELRSGSFAEILRGRGVV